WILRFRSNSEPHRAVRLMLCGRKLSLVPFTKTNDLRGGAERVVGMFILLFLIFVVTTTDVYGQTDVDWKYYAHIDSKDDGHSFCFYDSSEISISVDRTVKVWTKCLSKELVDGIDVKGDNFREIMDYTAESVGESYVPPIATVTTISHD